uniref:Fetuin-B isoform 1 n=1 Tax=Sus scrofa TaxID=9823 RepID=A0A480SUZ7_PIG
MGLLLPLVLCALAVGCGATSPPQPLPPTSSLLLSHACNSSYVLDVVNLVLQEINRNQKDGYVLSPNRVSDVREHRQGDLGSLFYLTLDVIESSCHVLSKMSWKDCGLTPFHESEYGQCKAIFYINKARRIHYLPAYNCILRPVSPGQLVTLCPDCPTHVNMSDTKVLEAATKSLEEFNKRRTSKKYSLVKVTRALFQWVFGPAYFVEYLIKESPCTKSQASSCALQPPNPEPVGICSGSRSERGPEKFVSVRCSFFKSQAPTPGDAYSTASRGDPTKVEEPQQESTASAKPVPKGSVQHLPGLGDKPKGSPETGPEEAFPVRVDLTSNPQGEPLDVSFLFPEPVEKDLVVLPFPSREWRSAECPGPARVSTPLVLPP